MIKFLNLKAVNDGFQEDFKKEFQRFLDSGKYILADNVKSFENEFAKYCGTKYCIGVSSGLDALELIFKGYNVLGFLKAGDEVIVPANTYIASVLAISNTGLKPVLVEPCLKTYNIDVVKVKEAITSRTKAILGVHLYGQLFDVNALEEISRENNLLLIEDAAQAHGAKYKDGRRSGNLANASGFSFYPTKNLGALGDAGAITTTNKALADAIFKLRDYGRSSTYTNDVKGFNCRLDELQAIFLRIKLKKLNHDNDKQRTIAKDYLNGIKSDKVILPLCSDFNQHVFHQFVIRSKYRNKLKKYLYENGVETLIHYPIPIHKQKAYGELAHMKLFISEQLSEEVLSLPIYNSLSSDEIAKIILLINDF